MIKKVNEEEPGASSADEYGQACSKLEQVLAGELPAREGKAALKIIQKHIKAMNAETRAKRAELKKLGVKIPKVPKF